MRWGLALVLASAACGPERALAPIAPCTTSEQENDVAVVETARTADVLVVLDGTLTTRAATRTLAEAMPAFLDGLASGDVDHDGRVEATPMSSIRVGVVTSDRGMTSDCRGEPRTRFVRGRGTDESGIFAWSGGAMAADLADTLVNATGSGCAATQPMAAAADGARLFPTTQNGLVRPEGVLVVIVVTDREDEADLPADVVVSELEPLRSDPEMIVLAVVADVPPRLAGALPSVVLADPALDGGAPRCASSARSAPPRRLLEEADALVNEGSGVFVGSICAPDDTAMLDAVSAGVARCVVGVGVCIRSRYVLAPDGTLPCDLEALLPPIGSDARYTHCAEVGEPYVLARTEEEQVGEHVAQREACRIAQLSPQQVLGSTDRGWYYDDGTLGDASERPSYCAASVSLRDTPVVVGSVLRMHCAEHFDRIAALGASCDPATGAIEAGGRCSDARLACDPLTRSCGVACVTDADCTLAGRVDDVCDTRSARELVAPDLIPVGTAPDAPHDFCVSPTCD